MATTVEPTTQHPSAAPVPPSGPWFRDRRRLITAGAGAAAVAVLVGYFVVESAARKERFAERSLSEARQAAESGNLPAASSQLQKLIQTYRGTDAAAQGVITLNQIRLINNQSELAVTNLREFLASKPERRYATPAAGLLGAALENAKRWSEAGDAYTQAAQTADAEYLAAWYLIQAGRAYQVGGLRDKASGAYRAVIERHAKTPSVPEAQVRLGELTEGRQGALPDTGTSSAK